jgi:hypothetical protein
MAKMKTVRMVVCAGWLLLMAAAGSARAQSAVMPPGAGSVASPYLIGEIGHLAWMSENAGSSSGIYYTLQNDIDASGTASWNAGAGFSPIGTNAASGGFRGVFDGNGKVVRQLTINRPDQDEIGLFGNLGDGGAIRNARLDGGSINGRDTVGGVVGKNNSGTVSNCHSTVAVTGRDYVGGLAGANGYLVVNSDATASVIGRQIVGGLFGSTYFGYVDRCSAAGPVKATGDFVGGLVGKCTSSIILNSFATGRVAGNQTVGGLLGSMGDTYLAYAYAAGQVSGGSPVGGLLGEIRPKVAVDSRIVSSYWDLEATQQILSAGGTGKTTSQMKQAATFSLWDFAEVWRIAENSSYPFFAAPAYTAFSLNQSVRCAGSGWSRTFVMDLTHFQNLVEQNGYQTYTVNYPLYHNIWTGIYLYDYNAAAFSAVTWALNLDL